MGRGLVRCYLFVDCGRMSNKAKYKKLDVELALRYQNGDVI